MRKKRSILIVIILFILILGGTLSGSVLASGGQRLDPMDLMAVEPTSLTLQESLDGLDWTPIIGDLDQGYSMVIDPENQYEYLDVATLSATPVLEDGLHDFYFDAFRAPEGFWTYWADQGVVEGAPGWQGTMWAIINGETPMFYLEVSEGGTEFALIDGFQYQLDETMAPLRVNGDYPLGTYHFGGEVTDIEDGTEYLNIQITFTRQAAVSLTSNAWTIDGCGYLDVTIHLADVHDLYAVDLSLSFDPAVLEVMDLGIAEGINLQPINTWFNSEYLVYNEADNSGGTIRYVASQQRPTDPVDGSGDIAIIRFRAKSIGSSDISVTGADLSDRDGYLVGREVILESGTVTTGFSEASTPVLYISRLNQTDVQLSWDVASTNDVSSYYLYRSETPYFDVDASNPYQVFANTGANPMTFVDSVLGNIDVNYFYSLKAECVTGMKSPSSDQVGKFEYELYENFDDTDFSWVGLVLDTPEEITNASDLVNHIQNNSNSTVNVETVSEWKPSGQGISLFDSSDPNGTFNFPVEINFPYRIEINIPASSTGSIFWAQVGKLPPIESDTYVLYESFDDTDFTWVLQPLYMVNIDTVEELSTHIETNATPGVIVKTITAWSPSGQGAITYYRDDPGSIFATRFGYPFRIEVEVSSGLTSTWP